MVQAAEPLSTRSRNCRGFDGVGERQFSSFKQELLTTDEVELAVETAYNKLERTQEMLRVSEEVLALLSESSRVQQELLQGAALKSQAAMAAAQEYDAKALLLQSQLDYSEAQDEFIHAMGRTPE
jgi:hypothetical protein